MKILQFIDSLGLGGKERQLIELLKGLSLHRNIHSELAVMSYDQHYSELDALNITIHYLIRKRKKDPRIFLELFKLCKKINPDIIHTWDTMTSVYASPITKVLGLRFLNGMIRRSPPKLKFFDESHIRSKLTFPFSHTIVSNSYAGLKSFKAPTQKSVVIHNGFDLERIQHLRDKVIIKKNCGIHTKNIVGMVANFTKYKDYQTYLSAAQIILQKRNDVTFLAVGSGENLTKSKKFIKPQFRSKIKFLGKQKNAESFINIFNVAVLATDTRFHGEGISNAIMEYMILEKPVIATDNAGTTELVINGGTGFLVKPADEEDMSNRINLLLNNKKLSAAMGKAGRQRIEEHFSFDEMCNSYVDLYRSICAKT